MELNLLWQNSLHDLQKQCTENLDKESFASFISKLNRVAWKKTKIALKDDLVLSVQRGYLACTSSTALLWACKGVLYIDKNWAQQTTRSGQCWGPSEALFLLLLPGLSFHRSPTWCDGGFCGPDLLPAPPCPSPLLAPSRPSVHPTQQGNDLLLVQPAHLAQCRVGAVGTWLGWHLLKPHGDPRGPHLGILGLVKSLTVTETGRMAMDHIGPWPIWTVLPARVAWSWEHVYGLWCLGFMLTAKPSQEYRGFPSRVSTPLQGLAFTAVILEWNEQIVVRK